MVHIIERRSFSSASLSSFVACQVAELLVWNAVLSEMEETQVEDYLMAKYSVGPPMCGRVGASPGASSKAFLLGAYPKP